MTKFFAGLAALLAVAVAMPVQAQFSDSFSFLKAVKDRDISAAREILATPGSIAVNARDRSSGEGALHILVRGRDLPWLHMVLRGGARPDLPNNQGDTPLILSSQIGWQEGVQSLLAFGANINHANRRGETALIHAVHNRDLGLVRLLLSQGADPEQADTVAGMSATDYARRDTRSAAILRVLENERPAPAQRMGPN